jgi:hypothetical protein
MNRGVFCNLIIAAGFLLLLCQPVRAWADACCDESSTQCRTGQNVGDAGSCTGSDRCVLVASECPDKKKHPGVLCDCGKPSSELKLPASLDFETLNLSEHPSETDRFKVHNPGNVPLNVEACVTAGNDAFSLSSATPEFGVGDGPALVVGTAVADTDDSCGTGTRKQVFTVGPHEHFDLRAEFRPSLKAEYTGNFHFASDAVEGLSSRDLSVIGLARGELSARFILPAIPISETSSHAEAACIKLSVALVWTFEGSSSSIIKIASSSDHGKTFGSPLTLVGGGFYQQPLIAPTWGAPPNGFFVGYTDETNGEIVKSVIYIPGQPIPAPTVVAPGLAESIAAGDGHYYLGVLGLHGGAEFFNSADGKSWSQFSDIPVNPSDFTADANIVKTGSSGLAAAWTDSNFLTGITSRFLSFSSDLGQTWGPPITLDKFVSPAVAAYFDPTLYSSWGSILDFVTASPNVEKLPYSAYVDYLPLGSSSPQHLQIGLSGFEGGFGRLYNKSFMTAVAIDTNHSNTLNPCERAFGKYPRQQPHRVFD